MAMETACIHDNENSAESSLQQTKWGSIEVEITDKICLRANHSLLCSYVDLSQKHPQVSEGLR